MKQPLPYYLFQTLNNSEKKELFELIHSFIKENNLQKKFNKKDRRAMFFYLFLRCNTYKEYEFVLFIAKIWVNLKRHTLKVCSSKFLKQ